MVKINTDFSVPDLSILVIRLKAAIKAAENKGCDAAAATRLSLANFFVQSTHYTRIPLREYISARLHIYTSARIYICSNTYPAGITVNKDVSKYTTDLPNNPDHAVGMQSVLVDSGGIRLW